MTPSRFISLLLFVGTTVLITNFSTSLEATPSASTMGNVMADVCFAAPRWWDDTVAWIRSIGWDRGRLVQLWLLFMLLGLYVMLRIKPRG